MNRRSQVQIPPRYSEKACKYAPFHLRGGFTALGDLKRGQVDLWGSHDDGTQMRRCCAVG